MSRAYRLSWFLLALSVAVVPPTAADTYLVYSEGGIPVNSDLFLWADCLYTPPNICDFGAEVSCDTPEGGSSQRLFTNQWGGWGVFPQQPVDLAAFEDGDVRFFVKTPFDLTVGIDCTEDFVPTSYPRLISQHGWVNDGSWQEITIPVCDLFPGGDCQPHLDCLANITAPFHVNRPDVILATPFWVDYVRWQTTVSHAGASSVEVQGRQLLVNGEPFVVNGMAYAPLSIGENWQGAWRDRPDRYLVDFPLIAAGGANAIRLYSPVLTTAMLDAAWAEGLYVIPTFGVGPDQLTCATGKDFMRDRFLEMVMEWKDHPAILFWLVGNEVNLNLGAADLCTDWFPQLDSLAQAAHAVDSSHPVGTANAGVADICVAGCSTDTALPNVDLWGTQIYRGCQGLDSGFADYQAKSDCARPLIVTEFGVDAWDGRISAENHAMQTTCLGDQLVDADQALAVRTPGGVSSGQVVFEWLDEWWKATCIDPAEWTVQDTCTSFTNPAYSPDADTAMNEEWWGIASQSGTDPAARNLRPAYDRVSQSWNLGAVCNMEVVSHNSVSGDTTISFDPAAGSTDHTLYYGPVSAVSSYGYSGSVSGLGADGSSSVTLPAGSLFWVVAPRDNGAEGCYGTDSPAGDERPRFSGAAVGQAANRTCQCSP